MAPDLTDSLSPSSSPRVSPTPEVDVLIIGSGFAGLCMGIQLRKAGRDSFAILEQGPDVGGTWRVNTYPGCACDIPSHLYSYSFECNPEWSRMYPTQVEIWEYLRDSAAKYDVSRSIRFNTRVAEVVFDEDARFWRVHTEGGGEVTARVVVSAMGGLSRPQIPTLPGMERFQGAAFHSAEWRHDVELDGKNVAVVGTGASVIQLLPEIAPRVARLHLFQRTPPWILPKPDRPIAEWQKTLFRRVPGAMRAFRNTLYWRQEVLGFGYTLDPRLLTVLKRMALKHLEQTVPDPELRRKLTPDYLIGCKRILLSNNYLQAMSHPSVEVVTEGIDQVGERSIVGKDGVERPVDAIIFGTGFKTLDFLSPVRFVGRGGVVLNEMWESSPRAYMGVGVAGFPNLFFVIGPNSRVANNSIVFMIEAQTRYIMKCLDTLRRTGSVTMEVRPEAQDVYNQALSARGRRSVFRTGCGSWYLDAKGDSPVLWPGFTVGYWLKSRRLDPRSFALTSAGKEPEPLGAHVES